MLEIKTNKEILKIKSRIYLGFTAYQLGMLIAGLIVGTILFMLLPVIMMIRVMIMVIVLALFVSAGMLEVNNMPLVRFLIVMIRSFKISNKWWYFETERKGKL